MSASGRAIEGRLKQLESHLERENPVLLETVQSFRKLDRIARRMGLIGQDTSYATQIPWWPLVSILGTFSSGKSTFINHYLDFPLQRTGNQAVDDKFSVICFSREEIAHSLPGVALDSDPRFPFYQMSSEIEQVAPGEGSRIDAYLQLKTCPSESLRGKILIDSPGFDADAQRTSTLRITEHIINLSDLVLVFFDARHPEPGAMIDTLDHLVSGTIHRPDSGKFLYILNQLDTTAREDNPEEVVAAWQRALGERGLTAGRFYTIYNPEASVPIEDDNLRQRFERKRDADLAEIHGRMREVEVERAYRIIGTLEKSARDLEERLLPTLKSALISWRKRVLWGDLGVFGLLLAGLGWFSIDAGYWQGLSFQPPWLEGLLQSPGWLYGYSATAVILLLLIHSTVRRLAARSLEPAMRRKGSGRQGDLVAALRRNTRFWRSLFNQNPVGWGRSARKRLHQVFEDADGYIQRLNDRFTNPSGGEELSMKIEQVVEPDAKARAVSSRETPDSVPLTPQG